METSSFDKEPTDERTTTGNSLQSSSNPIPVMGTSSKAARNQKNRTQKDEDDDSTTGSEGGNMLEDNDSRSRLHSPFSRFGDAPSVPQSLPNRFLRAPRLGSVAVDRMYLGQIPPIDMNPGAITAGDLPSFQFGSQRRSSSSSISYSLQRDQYYSSSYRKSNNQQADKVSYGSLRESQLEGRFLDGPSSYRDRRTGELHPLVRHPPQRPGDAQKNDKSNATANNQEKTLSIGERIERNLQEQKRKTNDQSSSISTTGTSNLSALLQEKKPTAVPPSASATARAPRTSTFYDHEPFTTYKDDMMSTSLTGLEILRQQDFVPALDTLTELLPRDTFGNNALLARSLSDPTGNRSNHHTRRSLVIGDAEINPSNVAVLQHLSHSLESSPEPGLSSTTAFSLHTRNGEKAEDDMDVDAPFAMDL